MKKIRKVFKNMSIILYNILPAFIYIHIFYLFSYIINDLTVRKVAKKHSLKRLRQFPKGSIVKSDTLFILGSGSSICDLNEEQWEVIKSKDSLGLNFWLYHDFVPTFYVYEESLDPNRNSQFYNILNLKKGPYKNTPFIVKDIEYKGITFKKVPIELRKNLYLSTEMVIFGDKISFSKFLIKGYSYINFINRKNPRVFLKKSGSLSYLLLLAENLGYQNIVLCGIDLNNSNYFYYESKYRHYSIPNNYVEAKHHHPTDVETKKNIPISHVVLEINEQILKKQGINLYVGSKNSALFPSLKCYFDEI
ncbi:hypothetical protein [Niallia sp. Krafla_26]|uniref:hypothetical protein n=1 Tax=Niallia sp. Krafla_26 TaxID=3064703 RepID=UPI003D180D90